jgi:hypothetical protein
MATLTDPPPDATVIVLELAPDADLATALGLLGSYRSILERVGVRHVHAAVREQGGRILEIARS